MDNLKISLLKEEDLDDHSGFSFIKKFGISAFATNLAIVTGAHFSRYTKKSSYWTKTACKSGKVRVIGSDGNNKTLNPYSWSGTIRPVLSHISLFNELIKKRHRICDGLYSVEFGEYPQEAADKILKEELEKHYQNNELEETGRIYTLYKRKNLIIDTYFSPKAHKEYIYNGRKFIRVKVSLYKKDELVTIKYVDYKDGDYIWLEVTPVEWFIDEQSRKLISLKGLLSGVPFNSYKKYNGDFKDTEMYEFLYKYMLPELLSNTSVFGLSIGIPNNASNNLSEEVIKDFERITDKLSPEDREAYINALKELKESLGTKPKKRR